MPMGQLTPKTLAFCPRSLGRERTVGGNPGGRSMIHNHRHDGKAIVGNVCAFLRRSFAPDEQGTIAVIFALMLTIVVAMVGAAVDFGRWSSARIQTQAAIDAALLAAGRTSQITHGDSASAVKAAMAYYAQMKSKQVTDDTIVFASVNSATSFTAKGSAYIQTPFLSMINIQRLPVLTLGDVIQGEATIAQGGNSGSSMEIGLMLDTTGSMGGQKLIDLKTAAKDLIDILIWDDQGTYTSRIAIAPFSEAVNVGEYFQAVTNLNPNKVTHTQTTQTGTSLTYTYPASCLSGGGNVKGKCKNDPAYITGSTPIYSDTTVVDNTAKAKCVVERQGAYEFKDTVPGPGSWITSFNSATGTTTTTCPEAAAIVPLTSDKTVLKAKIESLVAQNATAGAVGTAWAWYLISPDWGTIFTGASKPESYGKLTELGPNGQPRLQKIAILMTDGGYNMYQGKTASVTTVNPKAVSLCSGMKAKGIKVYTIGFRPGYRYDR